MSTPMTGSGDWSALLPGGSLRVEYGAWTSLAAILLVLVWYISSRRLSIVQRNRLPPGPARLPLIGSMHVLVQHRGLPHQALESIAKKYGPLITLQLGSFTTVVISSAEMAKEVLKTQNQHFGSRPQTIFSEIVAYDRQDCVWAPAGEHLRAVRTVCQMELLSKKRIASYEKVREKEVLSSVFSMLEASKDGTQAILLEEMLLQLSTNFISTVLFGKSLFGRNSDPFTDKKEFLERISNLFALGGTFIVGDWVPSLRRFDIGGHEAKLKEIMNTCIDKVFSRILEEHRSNPAPRDNKPADFVDILLALPPSKALTDITIKALMGDLLLGGTDSTANQVCWTIAEVIRHPAVLKKALAELDAVVGRDRLLTEADIPNLEYLQAIIKESFRLHPVASVVPYESTEATTVAGYYIPAKTRIILNNYAISRSEENWENALEFIPERFLESTKDVKGQDFEMLPFGSGRRSCVGINLGLLVVQLTVGHMLHLCDWSLPPGMKPKDVDITEGPGITIPMKVHLKLIATPRLAPSILNDYIYSLDKR